MNQARLLFAIRKRKYDLVIDLFNNPGTALITWMSGATHRVGLHLRGRTYAYNIPVERDLNLHSAEHNLHLLRAIGVEIVSKQLEFEIPESDMTAAEKLLQQNVAGGRLLIGLGLGGGWESKRCPPEKFASIADAVIEHFGTEVIVVWGPQDKTDAERIHRLMQHPSTLLPPTTMLEAAAFFKQCHAVIANDSGTMHVAAAVGTPTLGIFGPTNPYAHAPYGDQHEWVRNEKLDCLCCNLLDCPIQHQCMTELPVEQVVKALERLMQKNHVELSHANP
jgi:lipopolysaccharide heptosyltransferase II